MGCINEDINYIFCIIATASCDVVDCNTGVAITNFPKDKFWLGFDNYQGKNNTFDSSK